MLYLTKPLAAFFVLKIKSVSVSVSESVNELIGGQNELSALQGGPKSGHPMNAMGVRFLDHPV